jgi:hypothetical protein
MGNKDLLSLKVNILIVKIKQITIRTALLKLNNYLIGYHLIEIIRCYKMIPS